MIKQNFLAEEKIGHLMRMYAVPCIISLLVAALYNIVDQIFIANASYLGSYGNAANTVVFPLTVVALAVAVMIGDGACTFISISLGRKENDKASSAVGNAIIFCVASSLVITALYLVFQNQIITFFGGGVNEETFRLSKEYFFWITVGLPFYMTGQALNPIIRSDGSPKFAMFATTFGAVVNIILDPIFIFAFKWGMMGAAVATVAGQIATVILSVWYLFHLKLIRLSKKSFNVFGSNFLVIRKICALGMTSFLSQISLVAAMAAINNMIRKYSVIDEVFSNPEFTQIPMAVVGIVMKFFHIVISIAVGMAAGCIPIVGFNMGAGLKTRVKSLYKRLLASEAAVGLAAFIIVEFFPRALIEIFGASNESPIYSGFAVRSFRIYLCMVTLATVNKGNFIFLQSMGKALASTVISMTREVVFGVGFALLLPQFFALDGVLYSMPVSDLLTAAISAVVAVKVLGELKIEN